MSIWRKARPIVLAVSVALNLSVLSVWGAQAIPARLHARAAAGPGQSDIWCPLHRELGVTMAQWRQIEPRLLEFHERAQEDCRRLQGLRDDLLGLLAAPEPDMEAVRAKQEEILKGQGEMQELVVGRLLDEKKVLTPEQRARLFAMIRERMGCPGPGHMIGLSGLGTGQRGMGRGNVGRQSATPAGEPSQ